MNASETTTLSAIEQAYPGITRGIAKLNSETGCANSDEGFAGWDFWEVSGTIHIQAIWPQLLKSDHKEFSWDKGLQEFIPVAL